MRYTGAAAMRILAQDKGTAKKMFQFHGIKTPFLRRPIAGESNAHDISFPLS